MQPRVPVRSKLNLMATSIDDVLRRLMVLRSTAVHHWGRLGGGEAFSKGDLMRAFQNLAEIGDTLLIGGHEGG